MHGHKFPLNFLEQTLVLGSVGGQMWLQEETHKNLHDLATLLS